MKKACNYALRLFGLLALVTGAAFVNAVFAQGNRTEQQVAAIRKRYTEINERIAAGFKDNTAGFHHAAVTIGGEKDGQQWRAVGNMAIRNEYYFDCEPNAVEACGADPRKLIVKITTSYRAAGDLASSGEYLFNEAGDLIFAFTVNDVDGHDGTPTEKRFYFANGRLIRVVRGTQTIDRGFSVEDHTGARAEQNEARKLRNLFAMMFAK